MQRIDSWSRHQNSNNHGFIKIYKYSKNLISINPTLCATCTLKWLTFCVQLHRFSCGTVPLTFIISFNRGVPQRWWLWHTRHDSTIKGTSCALNNTPASPRPYPEYHGLIQVILHPKATQNRFEQRTVHTKSVDSPLRDRRNSPNNRTYSRTWLCQTYRRHTYTHTHSVSISISIFCYDSCYLISVLFHTKLHLVFPWRWCRPSFDRLIVIKVASVCKTEPMAGSYLQYRPQWQRGTKQKDMKIGQLVHSPVLELPMRVAAALHQREDRFFSYLDTGTQKKALQNLKAKGVRVCPCVYLHRKTTIFTRRQHEKRAHGQRKPARIIVWKW